MLVINWDKLNDLYKIGVTINELSDRFNIKKKTIYHKLKSNYPESRDIHKKNKREVRKIAKKLEKKECEKILLKESKKYIGDLEFIRRNGSIYETDKETGDIKLKTDYLVTSDVPKGWKNTYR